MSSQDKAMFEVNFEVNAEQRIHLITSTGDNKISDAVQTCAVSFLEMVVTKEESDAVDKLKELRAIYHHNKDIVVKELEKGGGVYHA